MQPNSNFEPLCGIGNYADLDLARLVCLGPAPSDLHSATLQLAARQGVSAAESFNHSINQNAYAFA